MPVLVLAAALTFALLGGSQTAEASSTEDCFTSRVNSARSGAGLPHLSVRGDLVTIARRHAPRMASAGEIFHNRNLSNEAPEDWQTIGENVGRGPDCPGIHNAFMASTTHRRNILDRSYNLIGVGTVVTSDGTIYVAQIFMESRASGAPAPAPSRPRATRPRPAPPRPPAPPPSPTPPPPPGSLVIGKHSAYLDILEKEDFPNDQEIAAYLRSRRRQPPA